MENWTEEYITLLSKNLEVEADKLKRRNFPKSLFKYRTLNENNINCLQTNSVWMSPADSLNDPYESSLCFNDDSFTDNFFKKENFAQEFERIYNKPISQLEVSYITNSLDPQLRFEEICKQKGIARDFTLGREKRKQIFHFFTAARRKQIRICSFSERNDSILMWSHYSEGHKGFCIEYDFRDNNEVYSYLEPVSYSEKVFDITPYLGIKSKRFANTIASITKAKDWQYEKEWRLTFPLSKNEIGKGLYKVPKPTALYLGTRFEENSLEVKSRLLRLAEYLKLQLFKMAAHHSEFKVVPM